MNEYIHSDLNVPAAAVVAAGKPLYPAGNRDSAAGSISVHPDVTPTPVDDREAMLVNPGFGRYFTDHIVLATWTRADGWTPPVLVGSDSAAGTHAMNALHYGQSIFEGLKAYRHADGSIWTFRPEANALRFQRSAYRLALPPVPTDVFIGAIEALVRQDVDWVPSDADKSLYLRPLEFGTENVLGVRPSDTVSFVLMASPVGAYFPRGVKPVKVWISDDFVRAAPGGTGEAKCAGNYAASLVAQQEATANGCDQVVWIDAIQRRNIEEMGGMNIFFVYGTGKDARIVTPSLTGTLLPGVTRDSLLTLAADLGYQVGEVTISVDEWREGCASGAITESFACGTAAVITPIGSVASKNSGSWTVGNGESGPITMQLREALVDVQIGRTPDRHNWLHRVV